MFGVYIVVRVCVYYILIQTIYFVAALYIDQ